MTAPASPRSRNGATTQGKLHIVPAWKPGFHDLLLEKEIHRLSVALMYTTFEQDRADLWARYSELHATRSPEMVVHLEKKQGLTTK